MLDFDSIAHRYAVDDKPIPSVTQILEEFFPFGFDSEAVRNAAHFGQCVHKATELRDLGKDADIDPQLEPWLAGWEKWKTEWLPKQRGVVIADIKTGAFAEKWFYQLGGYYELHCRCVMDDENMCKVTSGKDLIEFRAYSSRYNFAGTVDRIFYPDGTRPANLVAVQLFGDGTYRVHQSGNLADVDRNNFLSLCNVWHLLKKHKRLKMKEWNEYE